MKRTDKRLALIGASLAVCAAIYYAVYGAVYAQYADIGGVIILVLGAAVLAAGAYFNKPICAYAPIVGIVLIGYAFGLLLCSSFNVWQDAFGNLNMYGSLTGDFSFFNSEGGPIPLLILLLAMLAAEIMAVISCFKAKGEADE